MNRHSILRLLPASRLAGIAGASAMLLAATVVSTPADAQYRGQGFGSESTLDGEADIETFYRELKPYGDWFEHPRWGYVWRPDVDVSWRPYLRGHWVDTEDYGWYWVSDEPFGWATFHYGRWVFDEDEEEWLWIPGYEWAPAWVQWRESDDAVGWAPLPPDARFDDGRFSFGITVYDSPRYYRYWTFVPLTVMFQPRLWQYAYAPRTYSTYLSRTRPVRVVYRFENRRIYHAGLDRRFIERRIGRPAPVVRAQAVSSPRLMREGRMRGGDVIHVYRPRVVTTSTRRPPPDVRRYGEGTRRARIEQPSSQVERPTSSRYDPARTRTLDPDRRGFDRRSTERESNELGPRAVIEPEPRFRDRTRSRLDNPPASDPVRTQSPPAIQPRLADPPPSRPNPTATMPVPIRPQPNVTDTARSPGFSSDREGRGERRENRIRERTGNDRPGFQSGEARRGPASSPPGTASPQAVERTARVPREAATERTREHNRERSAERRRGGNRDGEDAERRR